MENKEKKSREDFAFNKNVEIQQHEIEELSDLMPGCMVIDEKGNESSISGELVNIYKSTKEESKDSEKEKNE